MIFKFNVFWSLFASGLAYIHLNNKITQIRMLQKWPGIVQRQHGLSAAEQGASYIQRLKPCGSFLPSPPSAAVVWHMQCWKRTDPSVGSRALQLTTLRVFCYVTEGKETKMTLQRNCGASNLVLHQISEQRQVVLDHSASTFMFPGLSWPLEFDTFNWTVAIIFFSLM